MDGLQPSPAEPGSDRAAGLPVWYTRGHVGLHAGRVDDGPEDVHRYGIHPYIARYAKHRIYFNFLACILADVFKHSKYAGHNYYETGSGLSIWGYTMFLLAGMNSIHNLTCVAIFRWLFISVNTDGYYWDTVEAHKHSAVYKCLILSLRF